MVAKVYVGNLSWGTSDDVLAQSFAPFGQLIDHIVMKDRETGRSRGFGFVTYETQEEADAAIQGMNEQQLDGRSIRVNMAHSRPGRMEGSYNAGFQGSFGGYGGYGAPSFGGLGASYGVPAAQGFAPGVPNPYTGAQGAFADPATAAAAAAAAGFAPPGTGAFGSPQGFAVAGHPGYGSPPNAFAPQGASAPPPPQGGFAPEGAYPSAQGGYNGQFGFPPQA